MRDEGIAMDCHENRGETIKAVLSGDNRNVLVLVKPTGLQRFAVGCHRDNRGVFPFLCLSFNVLNVPKRKMLLYSICKDTSDCPLVQIKMNYFSCLSAKMVLTARKANGQSSE